MRKYDRTIDFHPCVSSGVPLGLDWGFEEAPAQSIEAYEEARSGYRIEREEYAGRGRLDPRWVFTLFMRERAGRGSPTNVVSRPLYSP